MTWRETKITSRVRVLEGKIEVNVLTEIPRGNHFLVRVSDDAMIIHLFIISSAVQIYEV